MLMPFGLVNWSKPGTPSTNKTSARVPKRETAVLTESRQAHSSSTVLDSTPRKGGVWTIASIQEDRPSLEFIGEHVESIS